MTKNNQLERTYLEAVLNIRTGPYFGCSLTLAAIDGPYFRMVLIFGWSLFSVIYGIKLPNIRISHLYFNANIDSSIPDRTQDNTQPLIQTKSIMAFQIHAY